MRSNQRISNQRINDTDEPVFNEDQAFISFDRPEPSDAGHALTTINSVIRSTRRMAGDFRFGKTVFACSTAVIGLASSLGVMSLLQIFPSIFPATVIPVLDAGTGIMIFTTGIAIMDLAGVKLWINPRLAIKAITSAFGAYVFTFDTMGGEYTAISRFFDESDQQIDKTDFANYFNFALFTTIAATISAVHARVKYKNEQTRLAIAEAQAEGVTGEELPQIANHYMAAENATNMIIIGSTGHTFATIVERLLEGGTLNETPWRQLLRYGLSLLGGALLVGFNMIFDNKPARYINEFMSYLSSIDIATTLTYMLINDMVAGEELSETQHIIFMTAWPTMVAVPLLFELSRVFYNEIYSQRAENNENAALRYYYSENDDEEAPFISASNEAPSASASDEDTALDLDSEEESESETEDASPVQVRRLAQAPAQAAHHARFFSSVISNKSTAGDLHTMAPRRV